MAKPKPNREQIFCKVCEKFTAEDKQYGIEEFKEEEK